MRFLVVSGVVLDLIFVLSHLQCLSWFLLALPLAFGGVFGCSSGILLDSLWAAVVPETVHLLLTGPLLQVLAVSDHSLACFFRFLREPLVVFLVDLGLSRRQVR